MANNNTLAQRNVVGFSLAALAAAGLAVTITDTHVEVEATTLRALTPEEERMWTKKFEFEEAMGSAGIPEHVYKAVGKASREILAQHEISGILARAVDHNYTPEEVVYGETAEATDWSCSTYSKKEASNLAPLIAE